VRVDAYRKRVQDLLDSEEAEVLAIAIAALTGRRHAEVVAVGKFQETGHRYQLRFEGQQKKAEAEAFEIVSLVPVRDLLPVFERFRSLPGVQALVGLDDDHPQVQAFNSRVNRQVQALFGATGLVPVLKGFKTVSIHRLRALYGAIAVHFFCANNQHLHRFLQNHLGHVLTKEVGATNSRATDHYFHYYLVKEDGTPITARGVKLMAAGALVEAGAEQEAQTVEVEGSEQQATPEAIAQAVSEVAPVPAGRQRQKVGLLRFPVQERDRWNQVLSTIAPGAAKLEQVTALLEWIEARLELPSESQPISAPVEAALPKATELEQVKAALVSVLERLDRLEAERSSLGRSQGRKPQKTAGGDKATGAPSTRRLGGAADRANSILLAVQAWNRQHPEQSFAMSLSLLKEEFGINFKAARSFLEERQNDIWELHQASGVENPRSHNRREGHDVEALKQFVKEFGQQG
ncbi:MAG TPA: protelomerase family protein, partial [Thermosynechococcaceae cyanobacterium]